MAVKLVLRRKSEWLNRARSFKVLVDGETIGKIGSGKVEEFELWQVNQVVECKVDWCYSNKYELPTADGSIVYLQVGNGMKGFWMMYVLLLGFIAVTFAAPGFINSLGNLGLAIRIVAVGIPVLYLTYYLTVARRKYLKLDRDTTSVFT